jgi:hypothetical protein
MSETPLEPPSTPPKSNSCASCLEAHVFTPPLLRSTYRDGSCYPHEVRVRIIELLRQKMSIVDVAQRLLVSVYTVSRYVNAAKKPLQDYICRCQQQQRKRFLVPPLALRLNLEDPK